jgi:hypothetical protein
VQYFFNNRTDKWQNPNASDGRQNLEVLQAFLLPPIEQVKQILSPLEEQYPKIVESLLKESQSLRTDKPFVNFVETLDSADAFPKNLINCAAGNEFWDSRLMDWGFQNLNHRLYKPHRNNGIFHNVLPLNFQYTPLENKAQPSAFLQEELRTLQPLLERQDATIVLGIEENVKQKLQGWMSRLLEAPFPALVIPSGIADNLTYNLRMNTDEEIARLTRFDRESNVELEKQLMVKPNEIDYTYYSLKDLDRMIDQFKRQTYFTDVAKTHEESEIQYKQF